MSTLKTDIALINRHQLLSLSLSSIFVQHTFIGVVNIFSCPEDFITSGFYPPVIISDMVELSCTLLFLTPTLLFPNYKPCVILLIDDSDIKILNEMLENGVTGIICKTSPVNELIKAVQTAASGKKYIDINIKDGLPG
ncbi:MAG: response regulator transcription factor [Bacteroidetes bacterium]|nr:response regulator transcription factor [Bacteroidota bacterium]